MTEAMGYRHRRVDTPVRRDVEPSSADTVRCVLRNGERFLLLRKDEHSKNKLKWELPGGKIDGVMFGTATLEQQHKAVREEVLQETGIDISGIPLKEPARSYTYSYFIGKRAHIRNVYQFDIRLPNDVYPVEVNRTLKHDGTPEDHHMDSQWVTFSEYRKLLDEQQIAANSLHVSEILAA